MKKMKVVLTSATVLLATLLAACGDNNKASKDVTASNVAANSSSAESEVPATVQSKFVTIATGGASGPYNIIATTLTGIYSKNLKTNSKTQTTGASVENLNLMAQKKWKWRL